MEISYSSWPWHRSDATALAGFANMMMMMMIFFGRRHPRVDQSASSLVCELAVRELAYPRVVHVSYGLLHCAETDTLLPQTTSILCVVGRGGHVGVMFAIVWWRHCSRVSASMYRTSRQPVSIRYVTRPSTANQRRMQSCLETVRSNRTPLSPTNFVAPYSQNIWQDTHRTASLKVEKKEVRDGAPAPHLHPIGPPDLSVRHHCQLCGHRL